MADEGKTPIFMAIDGAFAGGIAVSDPVKEGSRTAIERLHALGLEVIMTLVRGDLNGVVSSIALSRATIANIKQNLFFAFIYNILGVPIAQQGYSIR